MWALQKWLKEAQDRTRAFYERGPQGPTTWILVQGKNFPPDMIAAGDVGGDPVYPCRGFHDVSFSPHFTWQLANGLRANRAPSVRISKAMTSHVQWLLMFHAEVGKASKQFNRGAVVGYGHDEIHVRPASRPLCCACSRWPLL